MIDSKKKMTFLVVSLIYSVALLLFPLLFQITKAAIEFRGIGFIILAIIFVMTLAYFQTLQLRIKRIKNPPIVSLTVILLLGSLGVAIAVLLLFGVSNIEPLVVLLCLVTYLLVTIWISKKLWLNDN
jgi:hypothetical protein